MNEPETSKFEREGSVESYEQTKQNNTFQIPRVSARTLVGPANPLNHGALEWGSHGLLAFGSNNTVVITDSRNVQHIQTLEKHKAPIQRVSWEPQCMASSGSALGLISSDAQGTIVVWDYLLLALHPPYSLILWDLRLRSKLWKKTYTETLLSFSLDPFDHSKLAFLCQDCILFVDDFSVGRIPSSNGRKFYVTTPQTNTVAECLQLQHHRSLRHHLLLLYPRELLILDLHINQTVGVLPLERSASTFMQVMSARQRDVIFCLHESGSVSVKSRKRYPLPVSSPGDHTHSFTQEALPSESELSYEARCHSEVLRLHKNARLLGMSCDPVSERKLCLFLSTGRLVFLELGLAPLCPESPLHLSHLIGPAMSEKEESIPQLRLQVTGLLYCVSGPLLVIRMCPALTTRNWQTYEPLMAGGTESGAVQVFNMATCMLEKEIAVHSYPVRGIEWAGLKSFLTFAYSTPSVTGQVRNELSITDVQTGGSTPLRTDSVDEPPIDILRVSPLKQYFVLCLKFGTFELWDLRNLCVLRTMPKKFPLVAALEWSPIHNLKALRRKLANMEEKEQEESPILNPPATTPDASGRTSMDLTEKQLVAREHFVFTDTESQLFHFSVEGNAMKDGIKIPPEGGVGGITSIAFKNDLIVQGDTDGLLNIWDLKARSSRNVHTGRGAVRKMRFAPGKGNLRLLLLYNDGVDVIDLKKQQQYERVSQLRSPRDCPKVLDVDWAASDKPVLAMQDGCLRIMDVSLATSTSPLIDYVSHDAVFCPSLLSPAALLSLRMSVAMGTSSLPDLVGLRGLTETETQGILREQVAQLSEQELETFNQSSISQRALAVARMFGCLEEIDLWTVVVLVDLGIDTPSSQLETHRVNQHPHLQPLDLCYDLLCDAYTYQRLQLGRAMLHEARRGDYIHTKRVVEHLILLGQTDRAVQLLLETELDNPNYYTDAIKACLVATIQSTGAAQSTIKLVATNLIANGNIWEGVQLLCLIGKGLDACRYLSSYGLWSRAAWLAKSVLPHGERDEVLKKWADHLASTGHKVYGALVMVSLGRFTQASALLLAAGLPGQAQVLLAACREEGILVETPAGMQDEISLLFEGNDKLLDSFLVP
ncbi:hypothetical protein B566_EDAN001802 [Ephemera danica]|nr:hypothetical protein B566_EDAN001802 [Ephemera danica]